MINLGIRGGHDSLNSEAPLILSPELCTPAHDTSVTHISAAAEHQCIAHTHGRKKKRLDALHKPGVNRKTRETETHSVSQGASERCTHECNPPICCRERVLTCSVLHSIPSPPPFPPDSCAPQDWPHHRGKPGRPLREAEGGRPDPGGEQPVHRQHAARRHRQADQGRRPQRHLEDHTTGR